MALGPIATRVKALTDGVYRAQRYGRRFRVHVADLLALVEEVDALEKKNTAVAVGGASKEDDKLGLGLPGGSVLQPPPAKKESSAQKTKEQK